MSEIKLPINNCYVSIQGEGVQTGVAMVLLRLHGCAVGCPWCDTVHTWHFEDHHQVETLAEALGENPKFTYMTASEIKTYIQKNHQGAKWVLITGGEPAQYPLKSLVEALHQANYQVALETSGTEIGHLDANIDWVCVSPKINMPGGKTIQVAALELADEIKHVVGIQRDIDQLDQLLAQVKLKKSVQLCLQPVSLSPKATQLCIKTVQERGWRLSLQTHKLISVP